MERTKGMITGVGFVSLTLLIKGFYSGEYANILVIFLAFSIFIGPTLLSYKGKLNKLKHIKT